MKTFDALVAEGKAIPQDKQVHRPPKALNDMHASVTVVATIITPQKLFVSN